MTCHSFIPALAVDVVRHDDGDDGADRVAVGLGLQSPRRKHSDLFQRLRGCLADLLRRRRIDPDCCCITLPPSIAAAILFTAGAFQFVPFKRACLMHCRNPLTYFLTRWRDGASGGFRMGFHHGLFCVACCWALMATTLAAGAMSLWWMLLLGTVTLLEQVSPMGRTNSNGRRHCTLDRCR